MEACEEALDLCKLLRLRCERAGDAEGAKQYAGEPACKAKLLREAQRSSMRSSPQVCITSKCET